MIMSYLYYCAKFNENRHTVIFSETEFIINVLSNDKDWGYFFNFAL